MWKAVCRETILFVDVFVCFEHDLDALWSLLGCEDFEPSENQWRAANGICRVWFLAWSFSCSIKFFRLKIALGLALGKSWLLLAQPQRNTESLRTIHVHIPVSQHKPEWISRSNCLSWILTTDPRVLTTEINSMHGRLMEAWWVSFSFSKSLLKKSPWAGHCTLNAQTQRDTDVYLCLCKNHQKSALSKTRMLSGKDFVFLCTADKLQCCHLLAGWNQHTQPSPPFIHWENK